MTAPEKTRPRDVQASQECPSPDWRWVSERGLRVATGDATLARYAMLVSRTFGELEDVIPADDSLLLVLRRGETVSPALRAALSAPLEPLPSAAGHLHEIAVEYGGAAGPDLAALAAQAGLNAADYIDHHAGVIYTVAFLGFQPGFPYLRGLPTALRAPRRATPRLPAAARIAAAGRPRPFRSHMIVVVRAGLCDLVMDLGRPGRGAVGMPAGGAADSAALAAANRLAGNDATAAGLEIVMTGPTLRFPEGGGGGVHRRAFCCQPQQRRRSSLE